MCVQKDPKRTISSDKIGKPPAMWGNARESIGLIKRKKGQGAGNDCFCVYRCVCGDQRCPVIFGRCRRSNIAQNP